MLVAVSMASGLVITSAFSMEEKRKKSEIDWAVNSMARNLGAMALDMAGEKEQLVTDLKASDIRSVSKEDTSHESYTAHLINGGWIDAKVLPDQTFECVQIAYMHNLIAVSIPLRSDFFHIIKAKFEADNPASKIEDSQK